MSFDLTKPVQTRCGLPAEIIRDNLCGGGPILAIVEQPDGTYAHRYLASGRRVSGPPELDLVNIPLEEDREVYLNFYPLGDDYSVAAHKTKREADLSARPDRIACKKVVLKYTEGEGLC